MSRTAEPAIVAIDAGFERWDELLALIHDSFAYMQGVVDPPASGLALTMTALREKALAEAGLLALADGRIVGCAFLSPREDHLYLGKLAVARDLQGRGIGRLLVRHAEDLARAAGKPALQLQTRIELAGNHKAFARLGFAETARTAHPGYDRPTSVTMRKTLAG